VPWDRITNVPSFVTSGSSVTFSGLTISGALSVSLGIVSVTGAFSASGAVSAVINSLDDGSGNALFKQYIEFQDSGLLINNTWDPIEQGWAQTITHKEGYTPQGDFIRVFCSRVSPWDRDTIIDPLLCVSQILFVEKDVQTFGALNTTSDPQKGAGGGCVQIGDGFEGQGDHPRINLTDSTGHELAITSGTTEGGGDYVTRLNNVLADLRIRNLTLIGSITSDVNVTGKITLGSANCLQWGTDTYLSRPSANVLSINNGAGGLGILNVSTIFVDHINSASGQGIYIMDTLKPYSSSINISGRVDSDSVIRGGGSGPSDAFQVGDDMVICDINQSNRFGIQGLADRSQGGIQFGASGPYVYRDGGYMRVNCGWITDGYLVAGSWANTNTTPLYKNGSGQIGYNGSSIRFKENVETLEDTEWVYNLRPVNFDWKDQSRKQEGRQIGLIAEEVNEQCAQLVFCNGEGKPEGVHYEWLGVPLLVELKKLKTEVQDLRSQLQKLTQREA